MRLVDLHCDTISEIYKKGESISLRKNNLMVDMEKLKESDALLQCFAMFINLKETEHPFEYANKLIDLYETEIEENSADIALAGGYDDILKNISENRISALLTIEEGEAIEGDIGKLHHFYNRGVRMMTLTWNFENKIAYPNRVLTDAEGNKKLLPETDKGLKPFGFEVVECMNALGMIVDVSHLGDAGIKDVLEVSRKPFVASHSNVRSICSSPRNLTDDMIKGMAERGCVAGLNFYPGFLSSDSCCGGEIAYIDDCIRMLEAMVNIGGSEFAALGSDYDGFDGILEWRDAGGGGRLIEAMEMAGFSESLIDNITHRNALRIFREVMG